LNAYLTPFRIGSNSKMASIVIAVLTLTVLIGGSGLLWFWFVRSQD